MIYQKENEKGKIYFATSIRKNVVLSTSKKGNIYFHSFIRFANEVELIPSPSAPPVLTYADYPVTSRRAFDKSPQYLLYFEDLIFYPIGGTFILEEKNGRVQTLPSIYSILGMRIKVPRYDTEARSELRKHFLSIFKGENIERKLSEVPHLLKTLYPFSAEHRMSYTARLLEWESEVWNFIVLPQVPQYILFVVKCCPDEVESLRFNPS